MHDTTFMHSARARKQAPSESAATAAALPTPRDPVEFQVALYLAELVNTRGVLPDRHPLARKIQTVVDEIVEAARGDPLLKRYGGTPPKDLKAYILHSSEPNAFIIPSTGQIFFGLGLVERVGTLQNVSAISGHEIGHVIHDLLVQSGKKPASDRPRAIWMDPVLQSAKEVDADTAARRVFSQGTEHFCDTYGSQPYLDAIGISPRSIVKALIALEEKDVVNPGKEEGLASVLVETLRTHPRDPERIAIVNQVAARASYPSLLSAGSASPAEELPIERPRHHLSQAINLVLKHSRALHTLGMTDDRKIGVSEHDSCSLLPNRKSDEPFIDHALPELLNKESPQTRFDCLWIMVSLMDRDYTLIADQVSSSPPGSGEIPDYLKPAIEALRGDITQRPDAENLMHWAYSMELIEVIGRVELPNILKSILVSQLPLHLNIPGKTTNQLLALTPDNILELDPQATQPNVDLNDLIEKLEPEIIGKTLAGVHIETDLGENEPVLECKSKYVITGLEFSEKGSPSTKQITILTNAIGTQFRGWLEKGDLANLNDALTFIERYHQRFSGEVSGWGSLANRALIERLAIKALAHFSPLSPDELEAAARRVSILNLAPEPYLSKQGAKFHLTTTGKIIPEEYAEDSSLKGLPSIILGDDGLALQRIVALKRSAFGPIDTMLDSFISGNKSGQPHRIDHPEVVPALCAMTDPTKLLNAGRVKEPVLTGLHNLHDLWALTPELPMGGVTKVGSGPLRTELVRGDVSIEEFIGSLKGLPHSFSEKVWLDIAEKAIRSPADFVALLRFLKDESIAAAGAKESYRERDTVHAMYTISTAIARRFPDLRASVGSSKDSGLNNPIECAKIVSDILPRNAARNETISAWFELIENTPGHTPEDLNRLAAELETEPYEECLSAHATILSSGAHKDLTALDAQIDTLPKAIVNRDKPDSDPNMGEKRHQGFLLNIYTLKEGDEILIDLTDPDLRLPVFGNVSEYREWAGGEAEPRQSRSQGSTAASPPELGLHISATGLRYAALLRVQMTEPAPTLPLPLMPQPVQEAERIGAKLIEHGHCVDPRESSLWVPGAEVTPDDLNAKIAETVLAIQPCGSPLRDELLKATLQQYESCGGKYSLELCRKLQDLAFQPSMVEYIGHQSWLQIREDPNLISTHESIDALEVCCPYYSLLRNGLLKEVRSELTQYGEDVAQRIEALTWTPGLPVQLPSQTTHLSGAVSNFQKSLLSKFEDYDAVETVLYLYGILSTKPWAVSYKEHCLGGTLDELKAKNEDLSAGERRAFLHQFFGGRDGILARKDPATMSMLCNHISRLISERMQASPEIQNLIADTTRLIIGTKAFPIFVRVQVIASLAEWLSINRESGTTAKDYAGFVRRLFGATGSAGDRLLQGLLIQPGIFPTEWKPYLRQVQEDTEPGHALLPFHLLRAQGITDVQLGRRRGGGSLAEVHEILVADGERYEGLLLKNLRTDTLESLNWLRDGFEQLGELFRRHNQPWSKTLIDSVIDSCADEGRNMAAESERTGETLARVMAESIGGSSSKVSSGFEITPPDAGAPSILLPSARPIGSPVEGKTFAFLMTDLGHEFSPLSRLERAKGSKTTAEVVQENGLSLREYAQTQCLIFFGSFISHRVLLGDPHFGNWGLVSGSTPKAAVCDFGSVIDKFPPFWHQWILKTSAAFLLQDRDQLRELLILGAEGAKAEGSLLRADEAELDQFINQAFNIKTDPDAESKTNALGPLVEFLYERWPLPVSVRSFAEAARKEFLEWGPHLGSDFLAQLPEKLGGPMLSALSAEEVSPPWRVKDASPKMPEPEVQIQTAMPVTIEYSKMHRLAVLTAREQLPHFAGLRDANTPLTAFLHKLSAPSNWNSQSVTGTIHEIASQAEGEGYIEIQDGDLSHLLPFDELRKL